MSIRAILAAAAAALLFVSTPAVRAAKPAPQTGFLCCNLYAWKDRISDGNYSADGETRVPVGTPVQLARASRYRLDVILGGKRVLIANDYSRGLDAQGFQARYIVPTDPATRIATFPDNVQRAIAAARVTLGMTREQVWMAVGYPIESENPSLDANVWRYWRGSFEEYQVEFDATGHVSDLHGTRETRSAVWMD